MSLADMRLVTVRYEWSNIKFQHRHEEIHCHICPQCVCVCRLSVAFICITPNPSKNLLLETFLNHTQVMGPFIIKSRSCMTSATAAMVITHGLRAGQPLHNLLVLRLLPQLAKKNWPSTNDAVIDFERCP